MYVLIEVYISGRPWPTATSIDFIERDQSIYLHEKVIFTGAAKVDKTLGLLKLKSITVLLNHFPTVKAGSLLSLLKLDCIV